MANLVDVSILQPSHPRIVYGVLPIACPLINDETT
jgi:hypothetical protein